MSDNDWVVVSEQEHEREAEIRRVEGEAGEELERQESATEGEIQGVEQEAEDD